jgi:hypothetical protein
MVRDPTHGWVCATQHPAGDAPKIARFWLVKTAQGKAVGENKLADSTLLPVPQGRFRLVPEGSYCKCTRAKAFRQRNVVLKLFHNRGREWTPAAITREAFAAKRDLATSLEDLDDAVDRCQRRRLGRNLNSRCRLQHRRSVLQVGNFPRLRHRARAHRRPISAASKLSAQLREALAGALDRVLVDARNYRRRAGAFRHIGSRHTAHRRIDNRVHHNNPLGIHRPHGCHDAWTILLVIAIRSARSLASAAACGRADAREPA